MTDKAITIVLIDDQAIIRAAFRSLIERIPGLTVIGDAGDARSGIELVGRVRPDLVVLDITMPGLSGIDAVAPLKKASPHTKVLMASQHEGRKFVQQALQAGADGYLSKDSDPAELGLAIESIHRGDSYLSQKVASAVMSGARHDPAAANEASALGVLTPREREVFQLLALGKANKEIASDLGISERTVKTHLGHLFEKLGVTSRTEAVKIATRRGLVRMD